MRTLADFPLGSVWMRSPNVNPRGPILVINHFYALKRCSASVDHFVYLCLMSGRTNYCLKGSRDFDELLRLA